MAGTRLPPLADQLRALEAERAELVAVSAPWRESRDAYVAQIQPLEAELKKIDDEIKRIERPRLGEIDADIAALKRALGGKAVKASLNAETGVYTKDE